MTHSAQPIKDSTTSIEGTRKWTKRRKAGADPGFGFRGPSWAPEGKTAAPRLYVGDCMGWTRGGEADDTYHAIVPWKLTRKGQVSVKTHEQIISYVWIVAYLT